MHPNQRQTWIIYRDASPSRAFVLAAVLSAVLALSVNAFGQDQEAPGEGVWRNYDFTPGNTVWFASDFSDEPVGRFPASQLEFVNGNMQIVEIDGEKALEISSNSVLRINLPESLPEDFTVEFSLRAGAPNMTTRLYFSPLEGAISRFESQYLNLNRYPGIYFQGQPASSIDMQRGLADKFNPVRFQADGEYALLYVGAVRAANLPNATFVRSSSIDVHLTGNARLPTYITNIVVAVGLDKLYEALMETGEFTTRGILFDFDSATIRPESTPSLSDILTTLTEHEDLERVIIEGHTDSSGDDAYNLELSERRAAAVVHYLVENGVDEARLEAVGKGETEPAADNATEAGRQQNRRVVIRTPDGEAQ